MRATASFTATGAKRCSAALPSNWASGTIPKDRALLVRGLKITGKVRGLELHTRTRKGAPRIILLSAESIEIGGKPCLVSVLHDVTDRIRAERALRESEEKFSKAFRIPART